MTCGGWYAFQRQRCPRSRVFTHERGFKTIKPGCGVSAFIERRWFCALASENDILYICGSIFKSGNEQKCECPCRRKSQKKGFEEEIYFSAFYLHPTPLRSTHRCSVGPFSLTAERRCTHVRVRCTHVSECVQKGVEIF